MRKKIISVGLIIFTISTLFTGCLRKKPKTAPKNQKIELTYYKLFDNEEILFPFIQEYQSKNKNVKIIYKKFTDVAEYENLLINELAEGEGPDIFEIHNTWIPRHIKKIAPMPDELMKLDTFTDQFVDVAAKDLIQFDTNDNRYKIYGIPQYVDTLTLYYNDEIYEDRVPSRGKPPETWSQLEEDVFKINIPDNSFERFKIAAIAMGRGDNILRSSDTLYLLFLQNQLEFYDSNFRHATLTTVQGLDDQGNPRYPAVEALQFYTSFSNPNKKNYSWNQYLSDKNSQEKEIRAFAKGKVAMIIGYSYLYKAIIDQIKSLQNKGIQTIKEEDVRIAVMPQIFKDKRVSYASYFAETVSRNSKYPLEAWKLIKFLVNKENMSEYARETKKPTSRRDLIDEQKKDPIYGPFAIQLGYAKSLPQYDEKQYQKIFNSAIDLVANGTLKADQALKTAENEINHLLPESGLFTKSSVSEAKKNQK